MDEYNSNQKTSATSSSPVYQQAPKNFKHLGHSKIEPEKIQDSNKISTKDYTHQPLYRLNSRSEQTSVFKPKTRRNFDTMCDQVIQEQKAVWEQHFGDQGNLKNRHPAASKGNEQSFEQMLLDDNFFSYGDFKTSVNKYPRFQRDKEQVRHQLLGRQEL